MCGGFRALCKTKDMPSKAYTYGEHSTQNRFYLFPTCLVICFCFLLTLGCILKTMVMKCLYLKFIIYLAHDFCLKRANKKKEVTFTSKNYSLFGCAG